MVEKDRGRPWQKNTQRKRTCYISDDPIHLTRFCPDNPKEAKKEESTVTGFVKIKNNLSESSDDIFFVTKKHTRKNPKLDIEMIHSNDTQAECN